MADEEATENSHLEPQVGIRESELGMTYDFLKTPKPNPGDILSPGSPDVPRLPKQRSPSGNQVLKSSRLWKTQRIQTSTKWELCSGHHHGSGLMWADLMEDVRDFCVFGLVLVGRGREWHRR